MSDDGLNEKERGYLQTPLSQMEKDQMVIANAIFDKKAKYIANQNAELRRKQAETEAKQLYRVRS